MVTGNRQLFGEDPVQVRESDHYKLEYIQSFVEKWDELIDWKMRAESEGISLSGSSGTRGAKVLDVATGTGFHSVRLLNEGSEVVSVDGSAEMLAKAFENGRRYGEHILRTVCADWRWLNRDVHGEYDAIICLGNSFTHLFDERDRRRTLAEFYAMLSHDGVLILDQRNYDAILDHGYSSKHRYYYCGDKISVEPEHVDEGLARFRYNFPDDAVYHLNMYPLRKEYTRRLMREVGFQEIETYGDFQGTYEDKEPDFFVHVAEKLYVEDEQERKDNEQTRGSGKRRPRLLQPGDADNFYSTIWGGEDIHIGIYESQDEPIRTASRRTVEHMASRIDGLGGDSRVLDLGAGYGGPARFLAESYGCQVVALNLSEVENERNRRMNEDQNLEHLVEVVEGSFEEIPYDDGWFDVVWSQDAILHSGEREKVFSEASRVLKDNGQFVFTDPMKTDGCPDEVLQPILDRLHLDSLGSPDYYRQTAGEVGLREVGFEDHTEHLPTHYARVLQETERLEEDLSEAVSRDYLERMKKGLTHWVEGGPGGI